MPSPRAYIAAALLALALTGCENGATRTADAESSATPETPIQPEPMPTRTTPSEPVDAWQTLATEFNSFYAEVLATTTGDPGSPTNATEMVAAIDYELTNGVTLAEYNVEPHGQYEKSCLTGPEGTYLTLTLTDDAMKRTLGTGSCDYENGDIVLELLAYADKPGEKATVGEKLAKRVPALAKNPYVSS